MFAQERHNVIEQFIREKGKVKVKELSSHFQVSEDCIRKDLKILENNGRLKRTYGGAILLNGYPLEKDVVDRKNYHIEKKMEIAKKAVALIKDRETIFLDISTTNIELAKLLADTGKKLVVVSNMIDILQILAVNPRINVIGTGGVMYHSVNGFMGISAVDVIERYTFDRAFIGNCGVDMADHTITTLGVEDGMTKKAAIKSSRHRYIMMEKEKFYFNECYKYADFSDVEAFITDEFPDDRTIAEVKRAGVRIL